MNRQERQDVEAFYSQIRHYGIGFALALFLTIIPFSMVFWGSFAPHTVLLTIAICAITQFFVQFIYYFHIDLSRQKREDLQLIIFTVLIIAIMTGGTIWVISNLAMRMM